MKITPTKSLSKCLTELSTALEPQKLLNEKTKQLRSSCQTSQQDVTGRLWPVMPRDKLFKPRHPQHEMGKKDTEVCIMSEWGSESVCVREKRQWCGLSPRSVGKAVVAPARERAGDAKGPALDLKGSDTAKPQVRKGNRHTVCTRSIF